VKRDRRPGKGGQTPASHRLDLGAATDAHDLTEARWVSWCEAAAVTLERVHGASSPKDGVISPTGRSDAACVLAWPTPADRTKRSHTNTTDATEEGAYAVASLAVHALDGWRIIARTPTESGADLWMARPVDDPDGQVRLEVSGIAEGVGASAATALRTRLNGKIAQLRRGKAAEPGIAAVVGFELVRVLVSELTER
jgi:hypothetical protein